MPWQEKACFFERQQNLTKHRRLLILYFTRASGLACWCFQASAVDYPAEVKKFLEVRESCDHWRGESGYDKERQAEIDWATCQSCQGTDAELARLKKKYKTNTQVIEVLDQLEIEIERKDKAAAKRFCAGTKKPKW